MLRTIARQGSIVAVLLLVTGSVALGASGGGRSSSSSISLLMMAAPTSGDSGPSYGQSVSFAVSTNATSQPFVHVECSQNGTLVYQDWQNWAFSDHVFNLGGTTAWQSGGAADCTATLENWDSYSKNGKITVLASTDFHVNA